MDEKKPVDAIDKVAPAISAAATGIAAAATDTADKAKTALRDLRAPMNEVLQQAQSVAVEAGDAAQDMGRRLLKQAGDATNALEQESRRVGDYIARNTELNPLTALLIAGAVGYGLAWLVHRR